MEHCKKTLKLFNVNKLNKFTQCFKRLVGGDDANDKNNLRLKGKWLKVEQAVDPQLIIW